MKCWLFFFFYLQPRNKPADLEASVSWWRWPIIFFFSTENNRTIPVSFSASHAFHNGFGEWSKKISSPFVGTAAGPFNGRHFFSGKIPFFILSSISVGEKVSMEFLLGKKGPNLNPFDSISQVSIIGLHLSDKKNTPAFFQSGADSKSSTSAHWRRELLIFRFRFSAWNDLLLTDVWTFQLIIAVDCNWIFPGKKVKVSTLNRPFLAETGGLGQLLDSV